MSNEIKVEVESSEATEGKGIPNKNESLERTEEQQLEAATKQAVVNKIEKKLKGEHPDWPEDKIKTIAIAAFNRGIKPGGKSSNEANEEERPKQTTESGGFGGGE